MKIFFDHIAGKLTNYDLIYSLILAEFKSEEYDYALDNGWIPLSWYYTKLDRLTWINARSCRLDLSKFTFSKKQKYTLNKKSVSVKLLDNPDKDILWIPIKNVFQRFEDIDTGDLSLSKIYKALSSQDLFDINNKLLATGKYTIAFLRGESKLALAPIRDEYKKIASDPKALQEYWKNEGFSAKQIKNLTTGTRANELAGNIARYEALKKTYPEFMDDPGGMANVMKRIKIQFLLK